MLISTQVLDPSMTLNLLALLEYQVNIMIWLRTLFPQYIRLIVCTHWLAMEYTVPRQTNLQLHFHNMPLV